MNKKEEVEALWKKYNDYKETAEQHMFVQLMMFDRVLISAHNDLVKIGVMNTRIFLLGE